MHKIHQRTGTFLHHTQGKEYSNAAKNERCNPCMIKCSPSGEESEEEQQQASPERPDQPRAETYELFPCAVFLNSHEQTCPPKQTTSYLQIPTVVIPPSAHPDSQR